jgi:hypothetical protein
MKALHEALRLAAAVALFTTLCPVTAGAQPGDETAKPDKAHETESMMQGAPNQDATLRDKNARPGTPVESALTPPKGDTDSGIHTPAVSPRATPGMKK